MMGPGERLRVLLSETGKARQGGAGQVIIDHQAGGSAVTR